MTEIDKEIERKLRRSSSEMVLDGCASGRGAELELETIVAALLVVDRGGIENGNDLRKEGEKF
ncbi:hypothetical protein CRG98_028987 [Punica granatum]|uniref:Uncharacterized protein n=1 Tax=Punica granatum TaxID=22663 RepID=A0A2I0J3T0_PUNGR|nr:hypothetical protein CRG98_028987 [Punica granatum]